MKYRKLFSFTLSTILTLVLSGLVAAQEPAAQNRSGSAQAVTGTGFAFQGYLEEQGSPVSGSCEFAFGLFDTVERGNQLGATQQIRLSVVEGLFAVVLNEANQFGDDAFNGQARWLEITVDCGDGTTTLSPRQALLAVPYAHSLRPGTTISGSVDAPVLHIHQRYQLGNMPGLHVTSDRSVGVEVTANHASGIVVNSPNYIGVRVNSPGSDGLHVTNADGNGVHVTNAELYGGRFQGNTAGIYARASENSDPDIILGTNGNVSNQNSGIIASDPAHPDANIDFRSARSVFVRLNADNSGSDDGVFNVLRHTNTLLRVESEGNVGIGTHDPQARLEIVSPNFNDHLILNRTNAGAMHVTATDPRGLAITDGTNTIVQVEQATGNVGIGTTNPHDDSDLHVSSGDFTRVRLTATSPANDVHMFVDARGNGTDQGQLGTLSNHNVVMFANSEPLIVLGRDGSVCIGNC